MEHKRPGVGVGVIIRNNNTVLLLKRKNAHGEGSWSFPGGHLEFCEGICDCAKREVLEETGLELTNLKETVFTNDFFKDEDKHYITIFVVADVASGTPRICEPHKCEKMEWFAWESLPENLFVPIQNLKKTSFSPFLY